MNENTTPSILQRVPVILAVTAASYGLPAQAQGNPLGVRPGPVECDSEAGSCADQPAQDKLAARH